MQKCLRKVKDHSRNEHNTKCCLSNATRQFFTIVVVLYAFFFIAATFFSLRLLDASGPASVSSM